VKTAEDVVKEIAALDNVLLKTREGPERDALLAILKHLEVIADTLPLRDEVDEPP
jgi:hypothetical protein